MDANAHLLFYNSSTIFQSKRTSRSLNQKKPKSESFTLSARLLTLLSICLNFEIPNTVCRSHELFLVHQEGHVSIANVAVLGYYITKLLCLNLASTELKSVER